MKRKVKFALPILLVVLSLVACAALRSKPAFVAFDQRFTAISKQYNDAYDRADIATKIKWHKDIDPTMDACDAALDAWRDSFGNPTEVSKKATLDKAFAALLNLLQQYKVLEVK